MKSSVKQAYNSLFWNFLYFLCQNGLYLTKFIMGEIMEIIRDAIVNLAHSVKQ